MTKYHCPVSARFEAFKAVGGSGFLYELKDTSSVSLVKVL